MENKPDNNRNPLSDAEFNTRLDAALNRLPNTSVPSNFTARVLDAIELEKKRATRSTWHWSWRMLFPRIAVAAAVLLFAGVSIQHYEARSQRIALVKEVAAVTSSQPLPSVEALENLDAIQRMSRSGHADTDLLVALQ